jgi:hypothetical protein
MVLPRFGYGDDDGFLPGGWDVSCAPDIIEKVQKQFNCRRW